MTAYRREMSDPTAVVGQRIGAWVIDMIIVFIFIALLGAIFGRTKYETQDTSSKAQAQSICDVVEAGDSSLICIPSGDSNSGSVLVIQDGYKALLYLAISFVAYAIVQGIQGASVGKLAVGLRVVDENGHQASMGKSFVRTILWIGDAITCGLPIVGGIMLVASKGHRRLGDMAAGTYVVPKDQLGISPTAALNPAYAPSGWGAQPPYPGGPAGPGGWGGSPTPGMPGMPGAPGMPPAGPPAPGGWGAPSVPQAGPPQAAPQQAAAPAAAGSGDGPTWDAARNAYIQYDRDRGAWLQWSDATNEWRPIDT